MLLEWPDRSGVLTDNRLDIELSGAGDIRSVTLRGFGNWAERLQRWQNARSFIGRTDWAKARAVWRCPATPRRDATNGLSAVRGRRS